MKDTNIKEISEELEHRIKPKGAPIAFKMVKTHEIPKYKAIKKLRRKLTLCQVLKLVAIHEKTYRVDSRSLAACVFGPYILGFEELPEKLKAKWLLGKKYTEEGYEKMINDIIHLPHGEYQEAIFGPLRDFYHLKISPDGVILTINPTQAYLLLGGYYDSEFKKPISAFNGHAACEIVAALVLGDHPWINIPCGGARAMAHVQDDEIWFGMSVEELESALTRIKEIDAKYPPQIYPLLTAGPHPHHPWTKLLGKDDI
ncbi:DUF169 domain-containing protein [Thermococcus argininiproducens]|uniref:DUF169 domain-containing protein n=1 Tax=Thermococcus argininiproducens TaxID=2866384 RepID=A0A9E7SCR6_9EURY|nr:DUF169 domain-containing protein [Thermococcus argininiproducens]USH00055.1 DUF169 domain-containing protein [Thermococcus argininiproducens]